MGKMEKEMLCKGTGEMKGHLACVMCLQQVAIGQCYSSIHAVSLLVCNAYHNSVCIVYL